jgi:FMN phosphatase YigB (HAD superfamily)
VTTAIRVNDPNWRLAPGRKMVLVDMDGTLADVRHREHFVRQKPKRWKAFFEAMEKDPPNQAIAEWVRNLVPDYEVVILSGRPAEYGERTMAWLRRNNIPFSAILMRRSGDRRPDYIVKKEILDTLDRQAIAFVIDDRASVCDMWRANGIRCFQIAEGNY